MCCLWWIDSLQRLFFLLALLLLVLSLRISLRITSGLRYEIDDKWRDSSLLESLRLLESLIMLNILLEILCTLSFLRLEVKSMLGIFVEWYVIEEIRSLLLSQWRLLLMLSVLLLARFLKWTLFLVIVMSWWLDSFWDSFSCERVSYGEGLVHEAWGCDVCVNMMISCLILMNWRVWWTRLLMISSVRRLSINCDCICLFWWLLLIVVVDCYVMIVIVDVYSLLLLIYINCIWYISHTLTQFTIIPIPHPQTQKQMPLIAIPAGCVLCSSSS